MADVIGELVIEPVAEPVADSGIVDGVLFESIGDPGAGDKVVAGAIWAGGFAGFGAEVRGSAILARANTRSI